MSERVAIVGAREAPPETLRLVQDFVGSLAHDAVVISGAARGTDQQAAEAARVRGIYTVEYYAHRTPRADAVRVLRAREGDYGDAVCIVVVESFRDALLLRNTLIAVQCTRMVVFPDGSKGGCWDAADQGLRFRRPVELRWADGRVETYRGRRGRV